jgi:uncharacterized sulfatase
VTYRFACNPLFLAVLLCLTTVLGKGEPAMAAQAERPNFIFILVDDMGFGDLGCYGNQQIKTPNIDRLAAEGVRFERYYSSAPICSPSRVALTTGQYHARHRINSYIDNRAANERRGMAQWLDPKAPSLARIFKSAGYRTAHVGKWHMGGGRDVGEAPLITEYGFDQSLTQFEGLGDRIQPTFDTKFPDQPHNAHPLGNRSAELGRGKVEFVKRYEFNKRYVDTAIDFIRKAQQAGEPFYVNLWTDDPHSPWEPSPANRGDGSPKAMYKGVVEEMDRDLGPLLDLVRNDAALKQNTVIVFASDNGFESANLADAELRGHKGTLYEGGIRDPFIVWWPGGHDAGVVGSTDKKTVLTGMDLPPTLLNIAGVPVPQEVKFDGLDQTAAYKGTPSQGQRPKPIFWNRPPDRTGPPKKDFPDYAVLEGNWKLLIEEDGTEPELYDVFADPKEEQNVAGQHPDKVKQLAGQIDQWRKQMPQPLLPRVRKGE